jgi:mono/diheme cytochrome c family protein
MKEGIEQGRWGRPGRGVLFSLLCASVTLWLCFLGVGCRQDMHDQPKYKALGRSEFFDDHRVARPQVEGTVARNQLREDEHLYTGKVAGAFVDAFPFALPEEGPARAAKTREILARGRERYGIYCAPCHGQVGRGDGMVVRRGYRKPASFHEDRLRAQPAGFYFDVISRGFGAMPDYAGQVNVQDRWAVVAYIRALQLSQNSRLEDVAPENRAALVGTRSEP